MICEDILAALGTGEICEETDAGARVTTHCLYPSFDPVPVFVTRLGDGFRVSDGGGAIRAAWIDGREDVPSKRLLAREAARYHLSVSGNALVCSVPSIDWLKSAIIATANASASAAHAVLGKVAAAFEVELRDRIRETLGRITPPDTIGENVEVTGNSGDNRHFDYGVRLANDNILVLSAVAPHHSSIAAKYVAFADTRGLEHVSRFAVYERPLERGDISLMMQVTELVPLAALDPKARKALAHA